MIEAKDPIYTAFALSKCHIQFWLLHPSDNLRERQGTCSSMSSLSHSLHDHHPLPPDFFAAMEDCNMLAADCVVISCCCQCLVLQITIFIFYKLPCKLIKKTREYTMKKLQQRRKGIVVGSKTVYQCENDIVSIVGESMRSMEEIHSCRCCIEEVDKVLEELYQRGEFGFGSFWSRGELGSSPTHRLGRDEQYDPSFVRYHLIEMVDSTQLANNSIRS